MNVASFMRKKNRLPLRNPGVHYRSRETIPLSGHACKHHLAEVISRFGFVAKIGGNRLTLHTSEDVGFLGR
jgi:hypothetical protein